MYNKSLEYWSNFKPIESYWHYTKGFILALIGLLSIISNGLVLNYFLRYLCDKKYVFNYFKYIYK